jgi:hypothetical protein
MPVSDPFERSRGTLRAPLKAEIGLCIVAGRAIPMTATRQSSDQKSYSAPKLTDYGSLSEMTKAISMTAANKDGGPNNTKSG